MKKLAVAALVVSLCSGGLWLRMWRVQRDSDVRRASNEIAAIRNAILAYREEYGVALDPKSDPFRVLTDGDNLRQIRFLIPIDSGRWPKNHYSDPWGRPYVFDLSLPEKPQIRSLGVDGRQSTDDVVGD